jgi:hypothetical protein
MTITDEEIKRLLTLSHQKPGQCCGGTCRPEWNWRSTECPLHWPWAVISELLDEVSRLRNPRKLAEAKPLEVERLEAPCICGRLLRLNDGRVEFDESHLPFCPASRDP